MTHRLTPQQPEPLTQCRAAIAHFERQHDEAVATVVAYARERTGVDMDPRAAKCLADDVSPWVDWTPRRLLAYIDALRRAADVMGLEAFRDRRDVFTIRDLVELTREIDMQSGMNGLYTFGEADRITEGPTSWPSPTCPRPSVPACSR